MSHYFLIFIAGMLATLSPCVLPAIPLIGASALQAHRLGPVVLGLGLTLSFTFVGVLVSTLGSHIGLNIDGSTVKLLGASLMLLMGWFLLSQKLQDAFGTLMSPLSNLGSQASGVLSQKNGLMAQFLMGCLLGMVWSPCSGPLLGAALGLVATSGREMEGSLQMFLFGLGSAIPLVTLSYASRAWISKRRSGISRVSHVTKQVASVLLIVMGALILTGLDRTIEGRILDILPIRWVKWITQF